MEDRDLKSELIALYFIIYGAMACFFPFLSLYMQDRKFTFTEIGAVFALNSIMSVVCQPIWGFITDKYLNKKKTLMITMFGSSIFILPFIITRDFYMVFIATAIYTLFSSSLWPVADAYCYEVIDETKNIEYGKIRLMGSVGYAVTALLLGMLIKETNINMPFLICTILLIPGILVLKNIRFKGRAVAQHLNVLDIFTIITNNKFIIFMISVLIINISLGSNGSYIAILIEKTGGNVSNLGFLWFIIAMSELPGLTYGVRLVKKYGAINIYIISLLFYVFRYLVDSLCTSYISVIAVQLMQGITYPLYLIASLEYINEIVPPRMRTSGMTLYSAIGGGIGGFLGNIGGGIMLDRTDIFYLFRIMAATSMISLIVAFGISLKNKRIVKMTLKG